jgi:hypothetical protein
MASPAVSRGGQKGLLLFARSGELIMGSFPSP